MMSCRPNFRSVSTPTSLDFNSMPAPPPPPFALIAAARVVARGFVEHAATQQVALTEGARAIWLTISALAFIGLNLP